MRNWRFENIDWAIKNWNVHCPIRLNLRWWSSMSWWKGLRRRWEWRKMGQRHADLPAMRQDSLWQRGKKSNSLLRKLGLLHPRPNFFLHLVYFIFTQPVFPAFNLIFLLILIYMWLLLIKCIMKRHMFHFSCAWSTWMFTSSTLIALLVWLLP